LSATVNFDDRDITGREQVFGLAGKTQREYRRVLEEPDFILCRRRACFVRRLHGPPRWFKVNQAQALDD
jgi:hypothetical protein